MDNFDWNSYFLKKDLVNITQEEAKNILTKVRSYLYEDNIKIAFTLARMMRRLMRDIVVFEKVNILELGAATGFLSRWFLNEYGGKATLVDNNQASYNEFLKNNYNSSDINYIVEDAFNLKIGAEFNIVCSFGLIEHFKDKSKIINTHIRFLQPNGYLVILVPQKTLLTQIYFDMHPELNCGYRELIEKEQLIDILKDYPLKVLNLVTSDNYVYDFIGTICKLY